MSSLLDLQIQFDGKSPVVKNANGVVDKRTTLLNLAKLLRGVDAGVQYKSLSTPGNTYVQFQETVVAASATATPAAVQAGDTVTIAGTALTATQKRASGTVTAATVAVGDTVTVNGSVFTAVAGAPAAQQFDQSGSNTATAASLAAAIVASVDPKVKGVVSAKSAVAVCTVYAVNPGTAGNSKTLASSSNTTLAVSGATLASGAAATNNTFDFVGTNAQTGASLADAITNSTTAAVKQVTASASTAGVVTVTSKVGGIAGNGLTFVSSNGGRLAVTGSGFLAGGSAAAVNRFSF